MKITDAVKSPQTTTIGQTQTANANNAPSTEKAAAVVVQQSTNVSLSPQVMEIDRQITTTAVFDTQKVEKIKLAIADGQFQVNSDKVADGLLDTVKDLLHSRKREA